MMFKLRSLSDTYPVHAYLTMYADGDYVFPAVGATARPLRQLTRKAADGDTEPGICIDVLGAGDSPDLSIELGVTTMLPIIEEAVALWYDDMGIDPPEYLDQPEDPGPSDEDIQRELQLARSCGCCECIEFISDNTPEPDCD